MGKTSWPGNIETLSKNDFQPLWREHSDWINTALISKWLPESFYDRVLKTDLFDECVCAGLYPYLKTKSKKFYGIDVSESIIANARLKYPEMSFLAANILSLPFSDGLFDLIVSNSTIDHFDSPDRIDQSLHEFYRVLKKDGVMILTMDNLSNMAVALRNKMPVLLNRIGIVPYSVGVTLCLNQLSQRLGQVGFKIVDSRFIMHCPRILCVAIADVIKKQASRKGQLRFLKILKAFECFSGFPTSPLTGYFVAVKAIKK